MWPKSKVKIALVRDFLGVVAGLRHHGEQIVHFIRRLDVEFVGLELHLVGVLNGLAGLDAEQDALHLGVIPAQIVGVVGGCHRDAGLPRQLDELGQNDSILFQAVVLQLNVVIALAEQVPIPQRCWLWPARSRPPEWPAGSRLPDRPTGR